MTIAEFMAELEAEKARDWSMDEWGNIRCDRGRTSPLCAVAGIYGDDFDKGASILGIDDGLRRVIVAAADEPDEEEDDGQISRLRAEMLRRLGLREAG